MLYGTTPCRVLKLLIIVGLLVPLIGGCSKTRHSRHADESGFLGDYSELKENDADEALLTYYNPDADWSKYSKIQLISVTTWKDKGTSEMSPDDRQALTDYLYHALHRELAKQFTIVDRPGSDVLQIRAAITEAEGANVPANAITTIVPQTRMLSTIAGMTADVAVLVGRASLEVEMKDSLSGQRLAAGVDRRVGAKAIGNAFSKWADVQAAYDHWAKSITHRLKDLQAGK